MTMRQITVTSLRKTLHTSPVTSVVQGFQARDLQRRQCPAHKSWSPRVTVKGEQRPLAMLAMWEKEHLAMK